LSEFVLDTIRLVLKFMKATLCKGLEKMSKQKGVETYTEEGEFLVRRGNLVVESL